MSSDNLKASRAGRPLNATAVALMVMLCLSWGFNQITVKLALPDIPPLMQATIRSVGGLIVLIAVAWARGVPLLARDGQRPFPAAGEKEAVIGLQHIAQHLQIVGLVIDDEQAGTMVGCGNHSRDSWGRTWAFLPLSFAIIGRID